MSATVSTDFLLRVAQATPEQQAAIERVLAGGRGVDAVDPVAAALARIEEKVDAVLNKMNGTAGGDVAVSESEAARVFLLMKRLEGAPKQRKAPVAVVFRLLVLEGLSQRAVAARCRCANSLVCARVAAIERGFGMSIERLRNFASELLSLESAAKGERTRKKKQGRPDDFERPEAGEDEPEDGGRVGDGSEEEGDEG